MCTTRAKKTAVRKWARHRKTMSAAVVEWLGKKMNEHLDEVMFMKYVYGTAGPGISAFFKDVSKKWSSENASSR